MATNRPPFEELTVIELAGVLAGPAVGMFFAELGATVVKIEPPQGDVTRAWRLAGETVTDGVSAYYSAVNWGKTHLSLDLQTPEGRAAAQNLARNADVVISNFKIGSDRKLGLDADTLLRLNPRLVYGHITGYGAENPRAGFDAIVQAEAGFMFLNGDPDGLPTKMPVALMDLLAAHQLKEGLLTALYRRERTGSGGRVSVSLIQAGLSSLANQATAYLQAGQIPQRIGSEHPSIAPYGTVFRTADDRYFLLAVGNDRQFQALCEIIALPETAFSPDFQTNQNRVINRKKLNETLQNRIGQLQLAPLVEALNAAQVPVGVIYPLDEAFRLPEAQPLLLSAQDSLFKGLRTTAFELDGFQPLALSPPKSVGADNNFFNSASFPVK